MFSSCSPVVVEQYYDWYVVVVVVRPCRLHVLWSTSTPHLNLDVVVNSESPLDLFDRSSLSPLSTSARPNQCNRSICRCMVLPGRHISSPRKFTPGATNSSCDISYLAAACGPRFPRRLLASCVCVYLSPARQVPTGTTDQGRRRFRSSSSLRRRVDSDPCMHHSSLLSERITNACIPGRLRETVRTFHRE